MREPFQITSFSNEKVKFVSGLKEKKFRDHERKIFIEGFREIFRALDSNKVKFHSLFICRECFLGSNEYDLIDRINCDRLFETTKPIFEKISYRDRPDGLIAVAEYPDSEWNPDIRFSNDSILIIEGVEKPGNLGTILRTAEGAGFQNIIVADPGIDLWNPNVIRASTGVLFTLSVQTAQISEIVPALRKDGYKIVSVTPEATDLYFKADLTGKIALLFGSEQYGLSDFARSNFDEAIAIPMHGMADSLNLAMATGILMYERIRQTHK